MVRLLTFILLTGCLGPPTLVTSKVSPDGKSEAQLFDAPKGGLVKIDRNFSVQLKELSNQGVEIVLARSPDEGKPDERFIWSEDNRYLLVLGKSFVSAEETWATDSDEIVYPLYDREHKALLVDNGKPAEFSLQELQSIEFEEALEFSEYGQPKKVEPTASASPTPAKKS